MAITKKVIGRVPVVRNPYTPGDLLYKGNLVTIDGVTYEVVADQTTGVPSESSANFRVFAGIPNSALDTKVPKSMIEQSLSEDPDKIPSSAAVSYAVGDKLNASVVEQSLSDSHSKVPTSKAVKTAVDAEATARNAADTALGDRITDESTAREAADTAMQSAIGALSEVKANKSELSSGMALERQARQSADEALQASINTEATTRWQEDATLDGRIDMEIEKRVAGDAAIDAKITAEVTAREHAAEADRTATAQAIAAEATQRTSADAELQASLGELSGRVDLITPIVVADEDTLRGLESQGYLVDGQMYCVLED